MSHTKNLTSIDKFSTVISEYKQLIEQDIKAYERSAKHETLKNYGAHSRVASDAFFEILSRGGKRIRGALVMLGYEMSGGKDHEMILAAARAIEMMHAYILIVDDIQDRSLIRRGGPTAHVMLADYHRAQNLTGDSDHFGMSLALNSALSGAHDAEVIISNLDAAAELRLRVLDIVNRTMIVTAQGQTNDIVNEVTALTSEDSVNKVMEWKTAHYSILNPLHVGMVLAGADADATAAITNYAIHTGKAYQITDDIIGIFGTKQASGKLPGEDVREGKQTLLISHALQHASRADKNFLIQMQGNQNLKLTEFERVKAIIVETGALAYARLQAEKHINKAITSLKNEQNRWTRTGVQFLEGLAYYLAIRE